MQMEDKIVLPAEWHPQSAVQLTWPHEGTDWAPILDEVLPCFASIAKEVVKWEKLLIVCPDEQEVRRQLGEVDYSRIIFREMATNDTWARDHGGITVFDQGEPVVYDFVFNGWGMKFAANLDNLITRRLSAQGTFAEGVPVINMQPFVLEGGSIESDGKGTLLTTVECLSSLNRNEYLQKEELEAYLKKLLHGEAFDRKGLIYGMGHAVYSLSDPREVVFKGYVEQLAHEKGRDKDLSLYTRIERMAPQLIAQERKIFKGVSPNVDFYSGFVYEMLGIPMELYTPLFAVARIMGWSAHRIEELLSANKIIRPAYKSLGGTHDYIPRSQRA